MYAIISIEMYRVHKIRMIQRYPKSQKHKAHTSQDRRQQTAPLEALDFTPTSSLSSSEVENWTVLRYNWRVRLRMIQYDKHHY